LPRGGDTVAEGHSPASSVRLANVAQMLLTSTSYSFNAVIEMIRRATYISGRDVLPRDLTMVMDRGGGRPLAPNPTNALSTFLNLTLSLCPFYKSASFHSHYGFHGNPPSSEEHHNRKGWGHLGLHCCWLPPASHLDVSCHAHIMETCCFHSQNVYSCARTLKTTTSGLTYTQEQLSRREEPKRQECHYGGLKGPL
jgi:hypothetical protein